MKIILCLKKTAYQTEVDNVTDFWLQRSQSWLHLYAVFKLCIYSSP